MFVYDRKRTSNSKSLVNGEQQGAALFIPNGYDSDFTHPYNGTIGGGALIDNKKH